MVASMPHIGITDLFWVFIMFTSLQPMLKQRLLEASRRRLIGEIERKRGSRVILLAHRCGITPLLSAFREGGLRSEGSS